MVGAKQGTELGTALGSAALTEQESFLFALGRLDRCDSEQRVAKFWLVALRASRPAARSESTAQALAALQGNSWKGRHRQGTWGHCMSPWNSEKQPSPSLHLSCPGQVIYLGSFLDTSRLKHVGTPYLDTKRHQYLPLETRTSPATPNSSMSQNTGQDPLNSQLIFSPAHTQALLSCSGAVTLQSHSTGGKPRQSLSDLLQVPK